MLIEDNDDIINWIRAIVSRYNNITLEIGHNTADYLELIKKHQFKIVLCDISLDYKDEGFNIVKLHKKMHLKSKIVAFTSGKYQSDLIDKLGFDCYLDKSSANIIDFFDKNFIV